MLHRVDNKLKLSTLSLLHPCELMNLYIVFNLFILCSQIKSIDIYRLYGNEKIRFKNNKIFILIREKMTFFSCFARNVQQHPYTTMKMYLNEEKKRDYSIYENMFYPFNFEMHFCCLYMKC